ncbi:crossover junction endodeoxyribonuclease RuvC [Acidiferrobacter sp.]|uniref:crossover junction endodeoxyribonuclease RuvC n=1 Tax=Acidiferrobacter sp. TaxID=1872107 RepID=UPI00343EA26B
MMRVLGVDPGSRRTGFGIVDDKGGQPAYVACGVVVSVSGTMAERLHRIFAGLTEVVECYRPDACAVERVFFARNPDSALKLGQARGAALVALAGAGLDIHEYTALQIKKATVGVGYADKGQVQHMIRALLGLSARPSADAADALACALCHLHQSQGLGSRARAISS